MKKGQLTIFVMLGLMAILIIGLVLMMPRTASSQTAEQDAAAVTSMVQQCLENVGEEKLQLLGHAGGYAKLDLQQDQLVKQGPQTIPLWHEIQPCDTNSCVQDHRPPLCAGRQCLVPDTNTHIQSIQENLESLTEQAIQSCLQNFSSDIVVRPTDKPEVQALIREEDVVLSLNYPLEVTASDKSIVDLDEFTATLDVKLPQMYRMAREIQNVERNNAFIEEVFLNLLTVYSGIEQPLPPMRDLQIRGKPSTWTRQQVQKTLEQEVLPYMNFIQLVNAQSYAPVTSYDVDENYTAYADGIYDYMTIRIGDESYPFDARFEYPETPMYLNINNQENLKPRTMPGMGLLSLMGLDIRDYRFRYTASFPVVVRIIDNEAFSGRGFELSFGLEANIKNNHPLNVSTEAVNLNFSQESLDLSSQLVNHTYVVKVVDKRSGALLVADLIYACGGEYAVGSTTNGIWTGQLPYCIGGYLIADAEGYAGIAVEQANSDDDGRTTTLTIELWPVVAKQVQLYKRTTANLIDGGRTQLSSHDSAVLQLQRIKATEYDEDLPMVLQFGTDAFSPELVLEELEAARAAGQITQEEYDIIAAAASDTEVEYEATNTIDLVPGKYELQGVLNYNGVIELPEEKKGGFLGIGDATLEARNLSGFSSGGVILVGQDAFELTPEFVYGENNLTLYVLEQKIPQSWDDVLAYQDIESYQMQHKALVRPE